MTFITAQTLAALLTVDGRAVDGGAIEIAPNARLLLDVLVEETSEGSLLDELQAAVAEAQELLADIGPTATLAQRVNGYTDHGSVSGPVTFNGPIASHRFDATGPTTITLTGFGEGGVATLICFTGAEDVTVVDAGDVTLVDGTAWSAELARGIWISGGGGGEPATPDTTPPTTAMTGLSVTPGTDGVSGTANWTAGVDPESTVKYRFVVYPTGDTQPAWPTSGALYGVTGVSKALTGLTASTAYTIKAQTYSTGGTHATVTTATFTTPAPPPVEPTWAHTDDFTATDGTSLNGRALPVGGLSWAAPGGETVASGADWGTITGNKIVNPDGGYTLRGGRITLPQANVSVQIAYDITAGGGNAEHRAYLWVTATSGDDTLSVQLRGDGTLHCFKGGAAGATLAGVTTGIAMTGTLRMSYSSGALTIVHPGGTATATIPINSAFTGTGRLAGFGARGTGSTADAFKAALL